MTTTYPRTYQQALDMGQHLNERDWNAMHAAVNGTTVDGIRCYPFDYIIRKNGDNYEAISSAHNLVYGGADDAGSVDGASASAVIQAAIDALATAQTDGVQQGNPDATFPIGGSIRCMGDITLDAGFTIPVWGTLRFTADRFISDESFISGDMITIGNDYASVGTQVIQAPIIDIAMLEGDQWTSAAPAYNDSGLTGIRVNQFDSGSLKVGIIRGMSKYGLFFDNGDAASSYDACADSHIQVNGITSCGVGVRTYSSSAAGSFCGGNTMHLGHLLGNYYGMLLDASTDADGTLTYTNSNSINNFIWVTAEDSISLLDDPLPAEACDVFVNCNSNELHINAKALIIRGQGNQVSVPSIVSTAISVYSATGDNFIRNQNLDNSSAGLTVGESPYTYQNTDQQPELVIISSLSSAVGVTTKVEFIRDTDAQTVFDVTDAVGAHYNGGCFYLLHLDKIRVTYTTAPPTMIVWRV